MNEKNQAEVIAYLTTIFNIEGQHLNYIQAKNDLEQLKSEGIITSLEYLNLLDALNCFNRDGSFANALIYKRAINT